MFLPLELVCLLFLPLDPNPLFVYTIDYPPQRRKHYQVDLLLETITLQNIDQAVPDIGI